MAVRTPLLAAALLLVGAAQADAQDLVWTPDRPDAVAPAGIFADRVLEAGTWEIGLTFRQDDGEGIRLGTDLYPGVSSEAFLDYFEIIPLAQRTTTYAVDLAIGLSRDMTLVARTGYAEKQRDQLTADGEFFVVDADGMLDTEVALLWEFFGDGPWRAHLQGGVLVPTGDFELEGGLEGIRTGVLPYDMQPGSGSFAVLPGATVQVQNEVASAGAQVTARIHVNDNDRDWRPGNGLEGDLWAAYSFGRFVSASARFRAMAWGAIEGADPDLDPFRDPGEWGDSFSGERVDLPLGVNLYMPEGKLAGHRLSVEYVWNLHEDLEGPWIAASNAFVVSWQKMF